MRIILGTLIAVILGSMTSTARADPYAWCAEIALGGGRTSCYFKTREQCQAAVSGAGGFCRPNPEYTGGGGQKSGGKKKRR
jgi:hypothetical protein